MFLFPVDFDIWRIIRFRVWIIRFEIYADKIYQKHHYLTVKSIHWGQKVAIVGDRIIWIPPV